MRQAFGDMRIFSILRRDERGESLTVVESFIRSFDRNIELGGSLFGRPSLGAHSPEELSGGKSTALKR